MTGSGTAIVIGATGLVGSALVDRLAEADHVARVVTLTRRPAPHASPKVENRVVDFDRLDAHADAFRGEWLFSCLGTTLRQAGSVAAQRRVDVDYPLAAARLADANGVRHCLIVSSAGADASSRSPYLRMKGEVDDAVEAMGFERVTIVRPSLLAGERDRARPGEVIGGVVLRALAWVPGVRRYRPIRGDQVAERLVRASRETGPGRERYTLDEIFID